MTTGSGNSAVNGKIRSLTQLIDKMVKDAAIKGFDERWRKNRLKPQKTGQKTQNIGENDGMINTNFMGHRQKCIDRYT